MNRLLQRATIFFLRPYIFRELPGWGHVYSIFVGDYTTDHEWAWLGTRWIRGKLHNYEMLLDLGQWSNRITFFLGRLYDLPTQLVLQKILRQGDSFIDVGANEGALSLLASRVVGPSGKVFAFEPNPKPVVIFRSVIERNNISNITIDPVGLSDRDEKLCLTAPKINTGEGCFGKSNYKPEDTETVQCEVRRGDDAVIGIRPALIKIDVEGFELRVLKGLSDTIARSHPAIVMEMVASHFANCGTSPTEVASFMTAHGYRPFRLGLQRRNFKHSLTLSPITIDDDIDADILWT